MVVIACCSSITIPQGFSPTGSPVPPNYSHPLLYQHPCCNIAWSPRQKINRVDSGSWGTVVHVHRCIFAADQAAPLLQQRQQRRQRFVLHTYHRIDKFYWLYARRRRRTWHFLLFCAASRCCDPARVVKTHSSNNTLCSPIKINTLQLMQISRNRHWIGYSRDKHFKEVSVHLFEQKLEKS